MYWVHHSQTAVCTLHQYQPPSHNPHLLWGSKYYWKGTPRTRGGVLRSWEVPSGFGGGPGEEHRPVGEDWGYNGAEIGLRRRGQEGRERRWRGGVQGWPWGNSGGEDSIVCLLLELVVLFFLLLNRIFIFYDLNVWVKKLRIKMKRSLKVLKRNPKKCVEAEG